MAVAVDEATILEVFGLDARVVEDRVAGTRLVVPIGRHRAAGDA